MEEADSNSERELEARLISELSGVTSPDPSVRNRVEAVFGGPGVDHALVGKGLVEALKADRVPGPLRLAAVLLAVKAIQKAGYGGDITAFLGPRLVPLLMSAKSPAEAKNFCGMAKGFLGHLASSAQVAAINVISSEVVAELAAAISANNSSRILLALGAAAQLARATQPRVVKDPLLLTHLDALMAAGEAALASAASAEAELRPPLFSAAAKLFATVYRYDVDARLAQPAVTSLWMDFFLHVLASPDTFRAAAKRIASALPSFFHGAAEAVTAENSSSGGRNAAFFSGWATTWGPRLIAALLALLASEGLRLDDAIARKTARGVERCIVAFLRVPANRQLLKPGAAEFASKVLLARLCLAPRSESALFEESPREFFCAAGFARRGHSTRTSALGIFSSLLEHADPPGVVAALRAALAVGGNVGEAALAAAEASSGALARVDSGAAAEFLAGPVLTAAEGGVGLLRARAFTTASTLFAPRVEPAIFARLVAATRAGLTDKALPVRAASLLLLSEMLPCEAMVRAMKPDMGGWFKACLAVVREFGHALLVQSLARLLDFCATELAGEALELLAGLVEVASEFQASGALEGAETTPGEPLASEENFEHNLFDAFGVALGLPFDPASLPRVNELVTPYVASVLCLGNDDMTSDVLGIFNSVLTLHGPVPLHPICWSFFEFLCVTLLSSSSTLPPQLAAAGGRFASLATQPRVKATLSARAAYVSEIIEAFLVRLSGIDAESVLPRCSVAPAAPPAAAFVELAAAAALAAPALDPESRETARWACFATSVAAAAKEARVVRPLLGLALELFEKYRVGVQRGKQLDQSALHNMKLVVISGIFSCDPEFSAGLVRNSGAEANFLGEWLASHFEAHPYEVRMRSFQGLLALLGFSHQVPEFFNTKLTPEFLLTFLLIDLVFIDEQRRLAIDDNFSSSSNDESDLENLNFKAMDVESISKHIQNLSLTESFENSKFSPLIDNHQSCFSARSCSKLLKDFLKSNEKRFDVQKILDSLKKELSEEIQHLLQDQV